MSTTEEHLMKTLGAKDIQIASLMAQNDLLKEQLAKLQMPTPKVEDLPAPPLKKNGKETERSVE